MMYGLLAPNKGDRTCLGRDSRPEPPQSKERVRWMTQRFSLDRDLAVREHLSVIARMFRLDRRSRTG